tara:strand:- start:369 stop:1760 length:1392 start_codon:yes stop_codon:yes gene_type:complete
MLFRELISEAAYLSKAELIKSRGINRVEVFLKKVAAGDKSPFTTMDGKRFDADPAQLADVQKILTDPEDKTRIPTLRSKQGEVIKFSDLAKTKEFGGQQKAWDEEATGKESFEVKPSQLWPTDAAGTMSAQSVYSNIVNSEVLKKSEIGQVIINIAKQIQAGQPIDFKAIDPKYQTAIRDYAGEYLGVLATINGTANFPNQDQFQKHLGANMQDINYFFPPKPNFPLGDSLASPIDGAFSGEPGTFIYISSKGGKKGAPPSLMNLKIPDNLRTPEFAREIEFIDTLQDDTSANTKFGKGHGFTQSLIGLNKLFELAPDKIPSNIVKALPFSDDDIARLVDMQRNLDVNLNNIDQLPENAQEMLEGIDFSRYGDKVKPSGVVMYLAAKTIVNTVNQTDAFPNFPALAREILQHNFIQIFARPKGGTLGFDVLWPNREMATGKVELYYKGSANEPQKQRLSFSVS